MSDKKNRRIQDYTMYDTMTTEELEDILRLDAQKSEEMESDIERLLYVMEVLANRKNANNTGKTAKQAWESFQSNYLPEEEDSSEDILQQKSGKPSVLWLRRMIAAAVILILVVGIPLTVNAIGWEKICEVFAKWTKDTFSFVNDEEAQVSEPTPEYASNCEELQEFFAKNKIDTKLVPTWIPDGYEPEKMEKDITPAQEIYRVSYLNDEKRIKIFLRSYLEGDPEKVEINEDLLEIYELSGVQYYIFSNMDQLRAVWVVDSYQCNISGDLSVEEIKMMIDSIGKG